MPIFSGSPSRLHPAVISPRRLASSMRLALPSERRSDLTPGVADALVFTDPKGTLVEVYSDCRFHPHDKSAGGIDPLKIGHVASRVHDVEKVAKFYQESWAFASPTGSAIILSSCGVA